MTDNLIHVATLDAEPVDRREVLRYAGAATETDEIGALLDECIGEIDGKLTYRVCYREIEIGECDGGLDLGFCRTESQTLKKALCKCNRIILFAATVGYEMDRLIARAGAISPARATLFQALGSERVESLCDAFNDKIKSEANSRGMIARPRVSAGYGDIPLDMQRQIFAYLDCARMIGVSLGDNLWMSPSKSVTAIIGLQEKI